MIGLRQLLLSSQHQARQYHMRMCREQSIAEHYYHDRWWLSSWQQPKLRRMTRHNVRYTHNQWQACGTIDASNQTPRRRSSSIHRRYSRDHTSSSRTAEFGTTNRRRQSLQLHCYHANGRPSLQNMLVLYGATSGSLTFESAVIVRVVTSEQYTSFVTTDNLVIGSDDLIGWQLAKVLLVKL